MLKQKSQRAKPLRASSKREKLLRVENEKSESSL